MPSTQHGSPPDPPWETTSTSSWVSEDEFPDCATGGPAFRTPHESLETITLGGATHTVIIATVIMNTPMKIEKLGDQFGQCELDLKCEVCGHARRTTPHLLARICGWDATLDVAALPRLASGASSSAGALGNESRRIGSHPKCWSS
jgi:hypothetical protein